MNNQILLTLVNNAALLLLIVYLYDLGSSRWRFQRLTLAGIPVGLALGLVGVAIMLNPMYMAEGVFFDTRSVLLGIAGLFFGPLPTAIAMAMTGAYRAYAGGSGVWVGLAVILCSGVFGLLWRRWRRSSSPKIGTGELYLFGVVLHVVMLLLMLGLPDGKAWPLLNAITWPVMLVYPVATALLGKLIGNRIESERQADALVESEEHFQALYQYAPVPLWKEDRSQVKQALDEIIARGHTDIEAYLREHSGETWRLASLVRLLDVNEAGLNLAGARSLDEIRGSIDRFFDEKTIPVFIEQMACMARGQSYHQGESYLTRLDGEVRDIVVSLFVLPGHEESYDLVMVSTLDISEQKNYQAEIRESHRLLANLSAHVPGMLFQYHQDCDGNGHYPYVSAGVTNIYEVTPEQVSADPDIILSRFHPLDRSRVLASMEYSIRTLEPWHEEYRVQLPSQGECWRSGSAQPLRQADGGTLWHGYVRDITERKRAETRLRLTSKVFDAAGEGVMITDAEQHIIAVNDAFTRVTGYSEAEVLGKTPALFSSGRHDASFYRSMWTSLEEQGTWAGDIWNQRKNGEVYPEWLAISMVRSEQGQPEYYVAVFSDLSEIRRAQNLAERMSMEDVLTGLANRSAFLLRLDRMLGELRSAQKSSAILLLDIDRFKDVNQAAGLSGGDGVLRAIGNLLHSRFGDEHLVARVGADEFAILIARRLGSREEVGRLALEIFDQIRTDVQLSSKVDWPGLDLSAGIVILPAEQREHAVDTLQAADWAAHQAKEEGGGRALFFASAMGEVIRERYRLEQELRHAAERNELRVFLQPQVNAAGSQVSAEALMRWQHPQRGLVPPGMFISLAEEAGFISGLERWMLAELCTLIARLEAVGQAVPISLNISARHFQRDDFVDEVRRIIERSGVDGTRLIFEITESIIIENMGAVIEKMVTLGQIGIHFSLDDFGTGYSSLSYLKRLPIHELKIDRSFITDAPTDASDAALVETILGVARTLGLRVVAEGVETQAQADFLNARGEVVHQGYLYDKPMPVAQWLEKYFDKNA